MMSRDLHRQSCSKAWSRRDILEEYEIAKEDAVIAGIHPLIYPTQTIYGHRISNAFLSGKSVVNFIASPQQGKTATSLQCIIDLTTCADAKKQIHKDNVLILTGMSDLDWKAQMTARMLPSFAGNIFHRNDIPKMFQKIKNRSDILIILDECHIATSNEQTIHDMLLKSGIWDLSYMIEHNIKILLISATPASVLIDVQEWDSELQCTIVAKPSLHTANYMGFQAMLDENRVLAFDIRCRADMVTLIRKIEQRYEKPKFHILRLHHRLRKELGQVVAAAGHLISDHNCSNRLQDVDCMLSSAPKTHHFIIIKNLWRASKTLSDKHIGICMDNSPDFTVVAQGLGGRLLGYNRVRGANGPILYTNVKAIRQYVAWIENGANYRGCELYDSTQLKVVEGSITRKNTSTMHYCEIKNARKSSCVSKSKKINVPKGKINVPKGKINVFKSMTLTRVLSEQFKVPGESETKLCTIYTKMTRADFLLKFNLLMTPDSARGLREMMIRGGNDVIVSYKLSSAHTDANLKTYYGHKQSWSAAKFQVIRLNAESDDMFIVIERKLEVLNSVKEGDVLLAHSHSGNIVKYRVNAFA